MFFNSYIFLMFVIFFLPLYYLLNSTGRYIFLLFCSLFFFSNINDLLVFIFSIFANGMGAFGIIFARKKEYSIRSLFSFFACLNILSLAYYKYFYSGLMPLALSFYTFEQITFLYYMAYSEDINHTHFRVHDYLLFISFFPRLLAGPIYYYGEYKDNLRKILGNTISWDDIGRGFTIFCLGLFKKIICADSMGRLVDPFYENPAIFGTFDTWFVTLAYSLQIYFDFSAYSEMAVGLGVMLGITLPLNFHSPYKATSIIDFWSRWHITLSRFIKDYIYIPLGGKSNQTRNILITMTIAGIWHGSGLNFILWGMLHGILITSNHFLRRWKPIFSLPSFIKVAIVFGIINTTWILFRSLTLSDALLVFYKYIGVSSIKGFHFGKKDMLIVFSLLGTVFFFPNIKTIFFEENSKYFKMNILWVLFCIFLFIYTYMKMNYEKTFIYFNF